MLRFKNPYAGKIGAEAKIATHTPAVQAWLQANPANRVVTLAELRAGLPLIAADLTRPVVNQILQNLGCEIENPENGAA